MTREVAASASLSFEEMTQAMMADIRVGRPGEPADIANAVAFFVDERSSFVTRQVLYVAGAPRG
jgi:3-oxoacyl-[acyl-carrier protein] reductase